MAAIEINSGMDHFQLIDAVQEVNGRGIVGSSCFESVPPFAGIEAMAQLAALHVRYRSDFSAHAYLLKIAGCRGLHRSRLTGVYSLDAKLESHSRQAFRYQVTAAGDPGGSFSSELLIGLRDYDHRFREAILEDHYRKVFSRLTAQPS